AARSYCTGTTTTSWPSCRLATGSPRDCRAPSCWGSDSHTWPSVAASMAAAICASNVAATSSYCPASSWSSTWTARSAGSCAQAAEAARAANRATPNRIRVFFISRLLLEKGEDGVSRPLVYNRYQLPALQAELGQLLLRGRLLHAAHHPGGQFHHLVTPPAHDSPPRCGSAGGWPGEGSLPALRSASRSTYSICALRLRSSSSDHRCIAASTSALMRS